MNGLRETCHCGHDVTSHYLDHDVRPAVRVSCLAYGCACKRFVNENEPRPLKKPAPTTRQPGAGKGRPHSYQCDCSLCEAWDKRLMPPDRDTDPYLP